MTIGHVIWLFRQAMLDVKYKELSDKLSREKQERDWIALCAKKEPR